MHLDIINYKILLQDLRKSIVLGLIISLPISILLNNIYIYLAIILFSVAAFSTSFKYDLKFNLYKAHPNVLYYILLCIGLFYSNNQDKAMDILIRSSSLLVFPIFLSGAFKISDLIKKNIFRLFAYVIVLYSIINSVVFQVWNINLIHHTYISMYLNFSIVIILYKNLNFKSIILSFICLCLIITTGSKMQMAISIIILNVKTIQYLTSILNVKLLHTIFIGVSLNVLIISIALNTPYTGERIKKLIEKSDFIRKRNWATNMEVISENYIFGVGIGDTVEELNRKRETKWLEYYRNYNSHNQFLETFIQNGLIGILALLYMLLYYIRQGILKNNELLLYFIMIISLSMLTESILQLQKGIVFFSLFSFLLANYGTNKKIAEDN